MKEYTVEAIPDGSFFSEPIYLDEEFILATPETPFSKDLADALEEWGFKEVFSEGELKNEDSPQNISIAKAAEALIALDGSNHNALARSADKFYRIFQKYTAHLYNQVTKMNKTKPFNYEAISANVKLAYNVIRKHQHILLWVQKNHEAGIDDNYQIAHSVKTMIYSILMGITMKLPEDELVQLGVSALLHEIGMMMLPTRLYSTQESLTEEDRSSIYTHPTLGYEMLKAADFPNAVCLGVLEHHERSNASGYPQKLEAEKISAYAKVIAVACSYEALTTHRPYKNAKDKHNAILEMVKNEGKQYDDIALRALVNSLSIYPVGLQVMLSNGKKAQVVSVDPKNPRFPVVRLLGMMTEEGKRVLLKTSDDIHILRPLPDLSIRDYHRQAYIPNSEENMSHLLKL